MSDITPGATVGNWQVASVDNRRATCVCVCGVAKVIAAAALLDRSCAPSCGCTALTDEQIALRRGEAERQQRQREMRGWRPQS